MTRELALELGPLLVNRTAVHAICRDTTDALATLPGLRLIRRYFGTAAAQPPAAPRRAALLAGLPDALERLAAPADPPAGITAAGPPTLFFDPLYVLFTAPRRADFVLCYDLSTLTHPHWHAPRVAPLYRAAFRRILTAAPTLIVPSRNTADTLRANFGGYPGRLVVLPLSIDPQLARDAAAPHALPRAWLRPFVLFVGSLETRKNVAGTIAAYGMSGLAARGIDLLVLGGPGHGAAQIEAAAAATEGVTLAGYVDDQTKAAAYAQALAFLYPSYLEGFGVPLAEAMAFGLPALASTTGACPEVGGDLVPTVDPDDHAAIASTLHGLLALDAPARRALRRRMQARIRARHAPARFQHGLRRVLGL